MATKLRWLVLGFLLAAWLFGSGRSSAQSAAVMFGSFSGVAKAIAVDTNGNVSVVSQ